MFPCPGCCGDAEYLTDDTGEAFSLVHCEFCGEDLDDADQVLRDAVERITQTLQASSGSRSCPGLWVLRSWSAPYLPTSVDPLGAEESETQCAPS